MMDSRIKPTPVLAGGADAVGNKHRAYRLVTLSVGLFVGGSLYCLGRPAFVALAGSCAVLAGPCCVLLLERYERDCDRKVLLDDAWKRRN